ncbi:MAG TPA: sigma-70 family RNA polymerase sigma factor [Blastococcus sp.]|jgi:serine/threonine-protein kinase RsbT|nr:sigma-70 family RNA polymerase sigma factor [Blastococcus sp.]
MGTGSSDLPRDEFDVTTLVPALERVIGARVRDPDTTDDLVQETLVRVLSALDRIEPGMLEPYAIKTARNVVATLWRDRDRERRNLPRVVDPQEPDVPEQGLLAQEEQTAVAEALNRLPVSDQETLLAHEVEGQDTASLAEELESTPGAVAARLHRSRARLRVEYLLALEGAEPPTDRCRPVLLALSSGDRRRQRELDVDRHLLECSLCERLSRPLLDRGESRDDEVRVPIHHDGDLVIARQMARGLAAHLGFGRTDLTIIATAVSEVTRNLLRFAGCGELVMEEVQAPRPGIRIVARDTGPGMEDVGLALKEGYSTDSALGLGLPGIRHLVDECAVDSDVGHGTTVTMTKWVPPA